MNVLIYAVDRPELPPLAMPDRFRHDVAYFLTPAGEPGVPALQAGETWIRLEDARRWLDELTITVVSPLDSASKAEIEITDEQEQWLQWMVTNEIERIRVEAK